MSTMPSTQATEGMMVTVASSQDPASLIPVAAGAFALALVFAKTALYWKRTRNPDITLLGLLFGSILVIGSVALFYGAKAELIIQELNQTAPDRLTTYLSENGHDELATPEQVEELLAGESVHHDGATYTITQETNGVFTLTSEEN